MWQCRLRAVPFLVMTSRDPSAQHLRLTAEPGLRAPVLICAFEGWNDAGDAASTTLNHLIDRWSAERFADIDPEEFFDFTSMRPTVEIVDGFERQLHWPDNSFHAAKLVDAPFDGNTALPILIFNWVSRPSVEYQHVAAAGIVVLLVLLMVLNAIAIVIRHRFQQRLT